MNPKLTTFIFDCFGVICGPILFKWYDAHKERTGFVDEKLLDTLREFDLGNISEDGMVDYFLAYQGVNSTKEELREELDGYFKLDHTLLGVIKVLKGKGFKTMMLSNANHTFFDRKVYPENPGFKELFDEIVISSSVKMVKPNADIFLHALEKIGSKPEESIFIDDNKANTEAAEKLGMKGYVYTNAGSFIEYLKTLGFESSA